MVECEEEKQRRLSLGMGLEEKGNEGFKENSRRPFDQALVEEAAARDDEAAISNEVDI